MKRKYGLIGKALSHSFSPAYFNKKFKEQKIDAEYVALELDQIEDFWEIRRNNDFTGFNVTIPYKEDIIPFLDSIDAEAEQVGAVNTIKITKKGYKGYNTDIYGFEMSLLSHISNPSNIKKALVLGTGGSSKAVQYVLRKLGISFLTVSRSESGDLRFPDIDKKLMDSSNLIINTTPLGMFPEIDKYPDIPYELMLTNYFMFDLIYNPEKTIFLSKGWQRGINIKNGLEMLHLQAEKAWEIWNQPETT
jgi:shikimate dehydrogenase